MLSLSFHSTHTFHATSAFNSHQTIKLYRFKVKPPRLTLKPNKNALTKQQGAQSMLKIDFVVM